MALDWVGFESSCSLLLSSHPYKGINARGLCRKIFWCNFHPSRLDTNPVPPPLLLVISNSNDSMQSDNKSWLQPDSKNIFCKDWRLPPLVIEPGSLCVYSNLLTNKLSGPQRPTSSNLTLWLNKITSNNFLLSLVLFSHGESMTYIDRVRLKYQT